MNYRRNFFLLLFFLPSVLFADVGPYSGAETGDIYDIDGICYELTTIRNSSDTCGNVGSCYDDVICKINNNVNYLFYQTDNPDNNYKYCESWYYNIIDCPPLDSDGDGYYSDADCNDTDSTIYPGAPEICDDGIDQDCDGYDWDCADLDQDGYTPDDGDCDETNSDINPGALDICGDGIDQDCDGLDAECQMVYTMTYDEGINGLHGVAGIFSALLFFYAVIKNS